MSRKKTVVWSRLTEAVAFVYALIIQSPLGRMMTSDRIAYRADALPKPASQFRLRCTEWLTEGHIAKIMTRLCHALLQTRVSIYGLIGFLYGILGGAMYGFLYYFSPRKLSFVTYSPTYLWIFAVIALLSFPLMCSRRRAGHALLSGKLTGLFFVDLLGIPYDGTIQRQAEMWRMGKATLPAVLLSVGGVVLTLWLHPLLLPACFVIFCTIALILTRPEAGAVLSIASLPLLCVKDDMIGVTVGLLLVTWLSFLTKWLLMRRNMQWSALDMMMLLLCLSVAFGGMTGAYVTWQSVGQGLISALILSVYFLITNLLKTRKALMGGAFGVLVALVLALPTFLASIWQQAMTADAVTSAPTSTVMRLLDATVAYVLQGLGNWWHTTGVCLVLLLVPLITSRLLMAKRVRTACFLGISLALCLAGLVLMGAWGGLCVAIVFILLLGCFYRHEILAGGIILMPLLIGVGGWLVYLFGQSLYDTWGQYLLLQEGHAEAWRGIWQLLCEHPAGIGWGQVALREVLPLYVHTPDAPISLLSRFVIGLGFPGIFVLVMTAFLFVQKIFTCLKHTGSRQNRLHLLGGMMSCLSLLFYGVFSSAPADISMMFAWDILVGLTCAMGNVVWSENQALTISEPPMSESCDKVYRI